MVSDVRRLEDRYRTLAEATAQVAWVSAPNGRVIEVSDTWTAFTGHPKAAALGRRFLDFVPPEDFAAFADRWAVALREGRTFEAEFRLRHASGHYLYVRSRSVPLHEDGRVRERIGTLSDVTARKVAEVARRMSEERFATAFDASPMPMAIRDARTQDVLAANQAYLDLTGYTLAELMAGSPGARDHWCGQPGQFQNLGEQFAGAGRLQDVQVEIRRKSGEVSTVMVRAAGVEIDGRACALVTLTDVTERVRAEAALGASEEMFSKAFNLSPIAMTIRDTTDGNRLIRANQAYLELTGYTAEEIVGTLPGEVPLLLDRTRLVQELQQAFQSSGRVQDVRAQLRRKSGEVASVLLRSELIEVGGRPCALNTVADVTNRRRLEESRRTLLAATAGVSGADFFRTLVSHLSAACHVRSAFVGELLPSGERMRAISVWTDGGHHSPFEYPLDGTPSAEILAHGTQFYPDRLGERFPKVAPTWAAVAPVSYLGMPLIGTSGKPTGVLAILHDQPIDLSENVLSILSIFAARASVELERIHAEAEIRRLNAELEQRVADRTSELQAANEELESFSYSVSHDLRAPLRHVSGFVELLHRDAGAALQGAARDHLGEIAGAASRMGTLIDNLLEFSRVGRAGLHCVDVDLDSLVREVTAHLSHEAADRRIVWDAGPLPMVHGDRNLLWQVFYNVLANAVKYTRPRETARIELGALPAATADQIVCFIRDNGVGFDMRYADKLFGVFQRLHAASAFEGTGIGLANVQRIVQRHGGRVWAEGIVGAGATFYLSLPSATGTAGAV
jgi:PAS domain S-box-containing protein